MFNGGGAAQGAGGFDMSNLLAQAQAMQSQLMEAQANLESQEVEGSAGGGLVTALVSGTGELLSLTINPQAVDRDDTETGGLDFVAPFPHGIGQRKWAFAYTGRYEPP